MKQPVRDFATTRSFIGPSRALALGLTLTLALNALLLPGWLAFASGERAPAAYALFLVLGLIIAPTYVERALRVHRGDSLFGLMGGSVGGLSGFAGSWILLLGAVALIILLGWSSALYLRVLLRLLFALSIPAAWLTSPIIFLIGLRVLLDRKDDFALRATLTFAAAGIIIVTIIWVGIRNGWSTGAATEPSLDLFGSAALLMAGLWSIAFTLERRAALRRATRLLPPALTLPLFAGGLLGLLVVLSNAFLALRLENGRAFLVALASSPLALFLLLSGVVLNLMALDQALWSSHRLMTDMTWLGFLPEGLVAPARDSRRGAGRWLLWLLFMALIAAFAPLPLSAGLAALSILWYTGLLFVLDALTGRRVRRKLPFRLPFYPLFPLLSAAIGFLLGLATPREALGAMLVWLLLGALLYVIYVRRSIIAARHDRTIFHETEALISETDEEVVMALVENPRTAPNLIRTGYALARARRGRLIALSVVVVSEQAPEKLRTLQATEQLRTLQELIERVRLPETASVEPLVRTAPEMQEGVLQAAREMGADLLVLGWEDDRAAATMDRLYDRILAQDAQEEAEEEKRPQPDLPESLNAIVESAACSVAVIRGRFPRAIRAALVVTFGEDDASTALETVLNLLPEEEGEVHLVQVLEEGQKPRPASIEDERIVLQTVNSDEAPAFIRESARGGDILILNRPASSILEERIFGGAPAALARAHRGPTLLLKPYQGAPRQWLREAWRHFAEVFPSLTPREHEEVEQEMREAARPSINFFVLITLAAGIAILGLLQNSAAVIIGAMLVAPLMSPIVAMAMGVVKGDAALLREAAEAASKGIALAILVGVLITLAAPRGPITNEIMNRTQPTLLDLAVALLSGAAAGYALSRKEVSAALPGVSIAVALVPPLCVVGYGIASAHFEIAGGAFLLFITNLVAITLAATFVFLTLGFRPATAREQQRFQQAMLAAFTALLIIAIPLAILLNASIKRTGKAAREATTRQVVENILDETLDSAQARVSDLEVRVEDDVIIVDATIYDFTGAVEEQLDVIEKRLDAELDASAHLRATLLSARRVGE